MTGVQTCALPILMFGLGGIFAEVMKDVSFRMAPVTPSVARDMIDEIKGSAVLKGARGAAPADIDALADAIRRLIDDPALRERLSRAGEERAQLFSWDRVGASVEEYYGFVIRRLADEGRLPAGFTAPIPAAPGPRRRSS